jgi:hypothetical protein
MLLAMNRRLRRTEGYLAIAFAAALVIGPDLAEAQAGGTPPAAPTAPQSPTPPAPPAPLGIPFDSTQTDRALESAWPTGYECGKRQF